MLQDISIYCLIWKTTDLAHLYPIQILFWEQQPASCSSELFMNRVLYSQASSLLHTYMKYYGVEDYKVSQVYIINLLTSY